MFLFKKISNMLCDKLSTYCVKMSYDDRSVYLVSNNSVLNFPENTLTSYANILPKILEYDSDVYMTLEQFSFNINFNNVPSKLLKTESPHFLFIDKEIISKKSFFNFSITIPPGNFSKLTDFMDSLNSQIPKKHVDIFNFGYNYNLKKFEIYVASSRARDP